MAPESGRLSIFKLEKSLHVISEEYFLFFLPVSFWVDYLSNLLCLSVDRRVERSRFYLLCPSKL